MKRPLLVFVLALGVVFAGAAGLGYLFREQIVLAWRAAAVDKTSLGALTETLAEGVVALTPTTGAPPYPVVIQFHGCGGFRLTHQRLWADVALQEGYAAVLVDSYGPRGLTREDGLAEVCTGERLIGQERAGDIAAALALVRQRRDLDPTRIVLSGWSHGAWSIMDSFALEAAGRKPASLTERPPPAAVKGAVLFYPYCGPGAHSRLAAWKSAPPTLALVGLKDTIVDPVECLRVFERLNARGAAVDVETFPDADHSFDDPFLPEGVGDFHHLPSARAAEARYRAFLRGLKGDQFLDE